MHSCRIHTTCFGDRREGSLSGALYPDPPYIGPPEGTSDQVARQEVILYRDNKVSKLENANTAVLLVLDISLLVWY